MAFRGDGSDRTDKAADRKDGEEAKPNERGGLEATPGEVGVTRRDGLVETGDLMLKLGANPADEKIAVGRHCPKNDRRSVLCLAVSLG